NGDLFPGKALRPSSLRQPIRPGLQYKLLSQSGPVHAPVFTMSVDVDGTTYEASGPSKKTAKLHVAVKVSLSHGEGASVMSSEAPFT
uniref:DRBM domain-containing protein n=1 Tax=Varanus komodoensis TaxID=61221 RepID=A0A8D2LVV8_VARKO